MCQGTCTVEFVCGLAGILQDPEQAAPAILPFLRGRTQQAHERKQAKAERYVRKRARANDT